MSNISMKLENWDGQDKKVAIEAIEEELRKFSVFLSELNQVESGPLAPWEQTLLRSYIVHKLRGHLEK